MTANSPQPMPPLGIIRGERLCASCSFTLVGQPVTRDPQYNLLIARCPECGTAASLQEYPGLSRWATRLAALLAMVYALIVLALLSGSAYVVRAWSIEGQRVAAEVYGERIALAHQRHFLNAKVADTLVVPAGSTTDQIKASVEYAIRGSPPYLSFVDPAWYESEGRDTVASDPQPWWPTARKLVTAASVGAVVVGFTLGVIWAALLWHIPRRFAWAIAALVVGPGVAWGAAFPAVSIVAWLLWYGAGIRGVPNASPWLGLEKHNPWLARLGLNGYTPAGMLAWDELFWTTWPVTAVGMLLACSLGAYVGRPIARFVLRLVVAPRLLGPISGFWTSDGLAPPRRMGY